jgi:2-hydroxychromene-2-carboxylate isomerase
MSGGSYDYTFSRIEDMAQSITPKTPLRKAFKAHLLKVAKACHDIEWVDSCDMSDGDENAAIKACLGSDGPALVICEAIKDAHKAKAELEAAIEAACVSEPSTR